MIPIKEVMTKEVLTFGEGTSVSEAAKKLAERRLSGAPVLNEAGYVVGVLSEVDVIAKKGNTVGDIMTHHVISISEDTGIDEAAQLFASERIRRLPILKEGRLVGLVSRSDILGFFTAQVWTCDSCAHAEHGLQPPERCARCGGTEFRLDAAHLRH